MRLCIFANARSVHIQRIVPGLVARGVDVHVVTHNPVDVPGATVEPFRIPLPTLSNPRRWRSRWRRYLRQFMQRFDVVHVHFLHAWGLTPEIIDEGSLVVTPWGSDIVPPPGEGLPTEDVLAERVMMLHHASVVTAWGPTFAGQVAEYAGMEASSIELLPLGVDLELFRPMTTSKREADTPHRIGFFKGFRPVYGPTFLMRAIPTVVEAFPNVQFHLVGDGPQLIECKRLAGLFGVDFNIQWLNRQPHRNIPNHLAGWDLTVIPSVCEAFGAAALESSAMCVPVVAAEVGGLVDTVCDGETGVLVPPKAPEQLADAVIRLLEDEPRRRHMGEDGRAFVEREFDWQDILDQWVCTYEMAMDRSLATV